jgi:hypothetical protein
VTRRLAKFHHAGSRIHLTESGFEVLPPVVSYRELKETDLEDAESMTEEEYRALQEKIANENQQNQTADTARGLMS